MPNSLPIVCLIDRLQFAKHGERRPDQKVARRREPAIYHMTHVHTPPARCCVRSPNSQRRAGHPERKRRRQQVTGSLLCPLVSRVRPPHRHGAAADDPPARPLHWRGLEGAVPRAPPARRQPGHRGHHRFVSAFPLSPIALTSYLQ